MGDDVEIEDGFDADLLGSEDEDERGGGEQEEALLGVDAVCVTSLTPNLICMPDFFEINITTLISNVKVASTLGSESGLGVVAHRLDSMEIEGLASFDTRDSDSEDEAIEEGRRKKRQVSISFLSSGCFFYCFALKMTNC